VTAVSGSASKGFPDLLCFRGTDKLALELKRQSGRISPEQIEWNQRMNEAGIEAHIVRPSDTDWIEQRLRHDPVQMAMNTNTSNSTSASWHPST
jgi:hypothetical protein